VHTACRAARTAVEVVDEDAPFDALARERTARERHPLDGLTIDRIAPM